MQTTFEQPVISISIFTHEKLKSSYCLISALKRLGAYALTDHKEVKHLPCWCWSHSAWGERWFRLIIKNIN